jgi:hypothetical protein
LPAAPRDDGPVIGAVLIALVLVLLLPAVFWVIIGVGAGVVGQLLFHHAEETHQGSDLLETNT